MTKRRLTSAGEGQRVDVVGGAGRATLAGASGTRARTDVAVLFEVVEGDVEIVGRAEADAGRSEGVAAGEGGEVGSPEPGEQDGQVGDGWIGAHGGVGGAGVLGEVVGE